MRCGGCRIDFPYYLKYCRYCGRRLRRDTVDVSYQTNPLEGSYGESSTLETRPSGSMCQSPEVMELLPRPIRMHVRTQAASGFVGKVGILFGMGCRWIGRAIIYGLNLII